LGIPAILAEIGHSSQFIGDWIANSKEEAFDILKLNQQWVDYIFTKLPDFSKQLTHMPKKE